MKTKQTPWSRSGILCFCAVAFRRAALVTARLSAMISITPARSTPFEFSITRPLLFEPNTFGRYRNVDPLTLGYLLREAVRKRGEEYLTYRQRALFD